VLKDVMRPYVVSFCSSADESANWFHYGRSGRGCALGFRSADLVFPRSELVRVAYDEAEQVEMVRALVSAVESEARSLAESTDSPEVAARALGSGTILTKFFCSTVAVRMKKKVFSGEQEWRLVTYDSRALATTDRVPISFRAVGDRVNPYKVIRYGGASAFPLESIDLGYSSPMTVNDAGLDTLLKESLGSKRAREIVIRRSEVPIR
jgi:hypothetical protein